MTRPPLIIALTPAERPGLVALVARLWPAEAEAQRVDPARVIGEVKGAGTTGHRGAAPCEPGTIGLWWLRDYDEADRLAAERALDGLVDALEDRYLVLDGRRVVGWAAIEIMGFGYGPKLVRIRDLDPRDARRIAHDDAVREARAARRAAAMGPPVADAKREHGIAAARAARRAR